MKKIFLLFFISALSINLFSQEALKSTEEEYYDFLSLQGLTDRQYLNYRTLSDSVWVINNEQHPWEENNISSDFTLFEPEIKSTNYIISGLNQNVQLKVFGPEWFNSYNTSTPFGQNDGALWQGRGYNTSFTTGFSLKAYGFSITIKPQLHYSQNLHYDIMPVSGNNPYKYFYGSIDAPQRFGNKSLIGFDFADSEIRFTWRALTVGFGTQSIWLGPAHENALLHSNHAASYPKFDAGIKRTSIIIPGLNWNLGEIEARMWIGYLSESDFFDTDESNNHNQIVGYTVSYYPPFLKTLTLGINKVCVTKWNDPNHFKYLNPFFKQNTLNTKFGEDQKASFTASWLFEKVGLEIYGEIGVDDFLSDGLALYGYARYPFHTITYTVGLKEAFPISKKNQVYGLINFEWNHTEMSQDYQMWGAYNFGFHHQITQGYTNEGQWLGSGIGYGGNSQKLTFTLYHKLGYGKLYIGRNNPDNSYIYQMCVTQNENEVAHKYFTAFKANFYVGIDTLFFIQKSFSISAGFMYNLVINPLYNPGYSFISTNGLKAYREYTYLHNFRFEWAIKYYF